MNLLDFAQGFLMPVPAFSSSVAPILLPLPRAAAGPPVLTGPSPGRSDPSLHGQLLLPIPLLINQCSTLQLVCEVTFWMVLPRKYLLHLSVIIYP